MRRPHVMNQFSKRMPPVIQTASWCIDTVQARGGTD